jgi:hypothetical protein
MVPFSGPGGVLVGADHGGVDHHLPVDLTDGIGFGLGVGEESLPGAIGLRAANRSEQVCQGPYRSGRSRQGTPVASFQRMPLSTRRWSAHWPPRRPLLGSSGAIWAQA